MPKLTPAQMKAAIEEFKKKFTPGFYHGSPSPNIKAFDPSKAKKDLDVTTPDVAVFVSPSAKFANDYLHKSVKVANPSTKYPKGATIYPVSVNKGRHFDVDTPEGEEAVHKFIKENFLSKVDPKNENSEAIQNILSNNFAIDIADPHSNWNTIESSGFLNFLKKEGYDSFAANEAGVKNIGVFDPKNVRGKFAKYNPEDAESPDFMKAEGGPVQNFDGGGKVGNILSLLKKLGLSEESIAAWKAANSINQRQTRNPILQQAAKDLAEGKITSEQYRALARTEMPIRAFTNVPNMPTQQDIANALKSNQLETGIVGVNKMIAPGSRVSSRLDIPAYDKYDKWIVSLHDPLDAGKSIGYGQTAHLKGPIDFTAPPKAGHAIATGKSDKTTYARIHGDWEPTDPQDVYKRAQDLMGDPQWSQVGLNPFRHSYFYDKADMAPVVAGEEALQVGPLVLVKKPQKVDPDDPRFRIAKDRPETFAGGGMVNTAVELAKKIAPKFSLEAIKNMPVSSAQKQVPVARAFEMLSSENVDPKIKQQIFKQYLQMHPDLVRKSGATNYDELTQAAYQQMAKETADQFKAIESAGVKLSWDPTGEKAYKSSKEMLEDALQNKRLTVFQGGEPHPALGKTSNEQFRAAHDYFGHGTTGSSFGPKGEELAYGAHSQMYSPLARLAAATETRGQNSLVSYSGMNEELINKMNQLKAQREQLIKTGGDPSAINDQLVKLGQQFKYAPQKPLILPPEQIDINYQGFAAGGAAKKVLEHARKLPFVHFSQSPSIVELDPRMYGRGIKGQEASRLKEAPDIKPRSYFYVDKPDVKPEPGLGPHKYQGMAEDIYPLDEDPLGLSAIAKQKSLDPYLMSQGIQQVDDKQHLNELERLIKQAGYKGYSNDDVGLLFYPTPVKKAVEEKAKGGAVFNPEGSGYDYQTALAYGMGPTGTGEDLGHWGSVAPTSDDERMLKDLPRDSYVMLKGKAHETFKKAEEAEKERGSKIVKIGDRYYSIPKQLLPVTLAVPALRCERKIGSPRRWRSHNLNYVGHCGLPVLFFNEE